MVARDVFDRHEDQPAPAAADPEAAFDAIAADLARGRWTAAAAQCDPASLAAFHRELGEQLDAVERAAAAFQRVPFPDLDTIAPQHYAAAYTSANEGLLDPMPGHADARYIYDDRWLLAGALGAESSAELARRPAHRAFGRWLAHVCPARRSVDAAARLQCDRPRDAAAWHRVRRLVRHPGAHADEAHLLYTVEFDDLPSDATAGRTRVVTCRRQPDGRWRLVATPDFLGADHPLVSMATLAALAERYTAARAAGELDHLAEAEDLLAAEAFYLRGSARTRARERARRGLYARYAAIFRGYAERVDRSEAGMEALKRSAFLSWRAASAHPERTLLAEFSEADVAQVWEWVIALAAEGMLDQEFALMLRWYYRLTPVFFDYLAALVPGDGRTLAATLAQAEGVPRIESIATGGRGALGRYFGAMRGGGA